jgi:hypothetical protein
MWYPAKDFVVEHGYGDWLPAEWREVSAARFSFAIATI